MRVLIDLGEQDRERLAAPERLEVDLRAVSMREAIIIQKGVEIGHGASSYDSVNHWLQGLQKGGTDDPFAYLVLVWLGLRRAGVEMDLADVDASLTTTKVTFVPDATDPGEPGKDESSQETTS